MLARTLLGSCSALPLIRFGGSACTVSLSLVIVFICASPAAASVFTLQDGNSQVAIGPYYGMSSWVVDGTNQLVSQLFFYRLGDSGGELTVDYLGLTSTSVQDVDGNGQADGVTYEYTSSLLKATLKFSLVGGTPGSYTSAIGESVKLRNVSSTNVTVHLFEYVDLDIYSPLVGDTVVIANGNTATQTDNVSGSCVAETVVTQAPDRVQAASYADLYGSLTDSDPTTLNGTTYASGQDVVWAFEWDRTLAPGDELLISKNKSIIPEPATMALLLCGSAVGVLRRNRKS